MRYTCQDKKHVKRWGHKHNAKDQTHDGDLATLLWCNLRDIAEKAESTDSTFHFENAFAAQTPTSTQLEPPMTRAYQSIGRVNTLNSDVLV